MVAIALAHRLFDGNDRLSAGACIQAVAAIAIHLAALNSRCCCDSPSSPSLAANAASSRWASAAETWFFIGSTRWAQLASDCGSLSCANSEISCVSKLFGSVRWQSWWLDLFRAGSPFPRL